MLRLHQLVVPLDGAVDFDAAKLLRLCAQRLRVSEKAIAQARLVKRSVDARGRGSVHFSLTADVTLVNVGEAEEKRIASRFKPNQVTIITGAPAPNPPDVFGLSLPPWPSGKERPLVVGAGPAGLFCALALAVRGARPIVVERGRPVEARAQDVARLEAGGGMNPESNVLFGEGGAGAFSDGKLTCGLNSPHIRTVLGTLVRCGAPEDVLNDSIIRQLYGIHDGTFNLLLGSVELCGAAGNPRVFVVPGEGRGAPCFRALQKRGIPFATGILQRCDVDCAVSETLAARRYTADSFSPPASDTLRAAIAAACGSACVVDSGAAIGAYNQENMELLRAAAEAGVPILTLRREALKVLGAARRFDTVRALADEAARLVSTGKGGASCPSSGAISDAIAGTA